ncbi:hypothetical protein M0805_001210 [Coniferiporia weirii]|nr:hypothetical protein M0805_001210 [Coniferiporia weirii]
MADANSVNANDGAGAWLHDEYRIIVYALVSLVLVVGGHRTWQEYHKYAEAAARRARILRHVESSRREKQRSGSTSGPPGSSRQPESEETPSPDPVPAATHAVDAKAGTGARGDNAPASASARITKRSKERRKRGRDVHKDVLKHERKKAAADTPTLGPSSLSDLHLQVQAPSGSAQAGSSSSNSRSPSLAGSSRSSSRVRSLSDYEPTEDTPRPKSTDWTLTHSIAADTTLDIPQDNRSDYSSMSDSQSSLGISTHVSSQTSDDHTEREHTGVTKPNTPASDSARAASMSPVSTHLNLIAEDGEFFPVSISQPVPFVPSTKSQPSWLGAANGSAHVSYSRTHPKTSSSGSVASLAASESSWENETQQYRRVRSKSPPPRFRSLSRASVSPMPKSSSMSMTSPSSTPPPSASLQTQVASYKGALEASRKREEQYRRSLEKFKQECDLLRYRWNEDADRRRRREAELETQLQHVTSQLQALSMTVSHAQMQPYLSHQQPNGFPLHPPLPFGYLPPAVPTPGANVMPLHSHAFPYPFFSNLPHMAPRNGSGSNIVSPSREYGPTGLGNFDVLGGSNDDVNEELAEAILKRPESIRSPSLASPSGSMSGSGSGVESRSASVAGRAARDGFTFASLSELGNPQPHRTASPPEGEWISCEDEYEAEGSRSELGVSCVAGNAVADTVEGPSHDAEGDTPWGEARESTDDASFKDGEHTGGSDRCYASSPSSPNGDAEGLPAFAPDGGGAQ